MYNSKVSREFSNKQYLDPFQRDDFDQNQEEIQE